MGKDFQRSLGLELSGPRSSRSVIASLDRYPKESRWILSDLHVFREPAGTDPDKELIAYTNERVASSPSACLGLGINAPLSLPPYLKPLEPPAPFPEESQDPEVKWMLEVQRRIRIKTPSARAFIPYLQRPAEIFLRTATPERFPIADAMSSNGAALAARALFLRPYLKTQSHEIYVRGSVIRLCQSLKMPKFVEHGYSSVTSGLESRHEFFLQLQKALPKLFLYEEHIEAMTLHLFMFNAFISAFTEQLIHLKVTDLPPHGFPSTATWIYLPKAQINWNKIFDS